jgi:metal-dependent amidase/aminoacylase/carboxypeptidase family protein
MPFDGVNALNAAALAILGVHANRETFREDDKIRIHPIITKGGDVVNSVPDEVCIDTYVRGASAEAIQKGNLAVERAVHGAAAMVGATATIEDIPGYLPLKECDQLADAFEENAAALIARENLIPVSDVTGSSDIGDLSNILPTIQPSVGGFTGRLHSQEFAVSDPEAAYLLPAKVMAMTVCDLLYENAEKAKAIKENFKPKMMKQEYINYLEGKGNI